MNQTRVSAALLVYPGTYANPNTKPVTVIRHFLFSNFILFRVCPPWEHTFCCHSKYFCFPKEVAFREMFGIMLECGMWKSVLDLGLLS